MPSLATAAFVSFLASTAALEPSIANQQSPTPSLLANAPSVVLHVTLKRQALEIHGHSEFDVYANPVVSIDNSSVFYDGYAEFLEGDVQFKYLFVGGIAYVVETNSSDPLSRATAQCFQSNIPFDSVIAALNEPTPIPSASVGDEAVACSTGNLFKTSFDGEDFALCASGASGFTAFGSEMDIEVKYMDHPVNISAPRLNNTSCPVVETSAFVMPTALALITGGDIPVSSSRNLKVAKHMEMGTSTCSCKSTPRPCIFFHGLGNENEEKELQDSSRHWGDMAKRAPCCTIVKYAALNTVDHGWTEPRLQQNFCDRALSMSDTSDAESSTIEDTIVVTHSMGGLVMSGALATGKCSFGDSATWVSLSAPMTGSMASDYLQDFCNDEISSFAMEIFELTGQCPMDPSRKSTMYQNEKYSSKELNAAYIAAQEAYRSNITTALCSNSYVGVFSKYQAISIIAGKSVPHKSPENDCLVEFQSCAFGLDASLFGNSFTDKFYMPELNHADTSFRTRDGLFKKSQKPAKWFECLL
ncbi:hypothetical protein PHYBOEH_010443 [Phytophthora boehmeriae]|uniref:GPI inositol-deacylase n=1 Tax=Phytophthora boehmeriae TaxID=109152 RepID=A0A8T1WZV2_9STRA|nr:hypothetical protein PHYBOEH_010443 [Phytophthora boehmeriae]